MTTTVDSSPAFIKNVYQKIESRLEIIRKRLNRPLNYTEKIIYGHLEQPEKAELKAGSSYIKTLPDRIALQDATAQMAILQFMLAEKDEAAVPVTVHCDHLIRAEKDAASDLSTAWEDNLEVYNFLSSASKKFGFGCWLPGSGIIHQVVLEQYGFPGLMMLGTDSHTPNAGGLGCFASGVGGADAVDVMVGMGWEVLHPEIVGVRLTGTLKGWAAPKDIILELLGRLTCSGGTNRVFEYFGPGASSLSCTGKATICNMGAELGATTSLFPYDREMKDFLEAANRSDAIEVIDQFSHLLTADQEVLEKPDSYYSMVIDIDLDTLTPRVVGPHSPDKLSPVEDMANHVKKGGYPAKISATMIGSCTNSSYEDLSRISKMAEQLASKGIKLKTPLYISPGSDQIKTTIKRDGQLKALEDIGAILFNNACGPCIGQWKRNDIKQGETNSILTSYNRNFPKRNDGNPETCCFIASPETCLAYAVFGTFNENPFTTNIQCADGSFFQLSPPEEIDKNPCLGFLENDEGFQPPMEGRESVEIIIAPDSRRLSRLTPFRKYAKEDFLNLQLLLKAKGKCTTDHISPAGPWLQFRGHLDNISDNMFSGAVNSFSGEAGKGTNQLTGENMTFAAIARDYVARGKKWITVGDTNYGEGSSREHAAMSPRHMGAVAIIAKSFARIHETNLKKQGVLPLTFKNPDDYELIRQEDTVDILGTEEIAPESELQAIFRHADQTSSSVPLLHSLNEEQISWFKAGSALNYMRGKK